MSDAAANDLEKPAKSKKLTLVAGLILAVVGAGAGYFVVSLGLLGTATSYDQAPTHKDAPKEIPDVAFVEFEPIMISLNESQHVQHLRFRGQLEVEAAYQDDVEHVLPRVVDVLNGYLRALDIRDLKDPSTLTRLRGQMLRRVQVVVGTGRVRDLLITEFVLN